MATKLSYRVVLSIGLISVCVLGHGSVLFDAKTHTPFNSPGCGKNSPYTPGKTTVAKGTYGGVSWTYRVYVPKSYHKNTPMPLILQHPGWGMTAKQEQTGCGITLYAEKKGFISVTPQGGDDNNNYGSWYSWNAVGSTQSPGPAGPTCTSAASAPSYCYDSCKPCGDKPQCDWTTCHDTVTPTGTGRTQVVGFIPALYDTLEKQLCIDTTREFAAGESNGGMMTYQLGVDLSSRLAAIAPQFGSFMRGFNLAPSVGVPVIDIHGTKDTTVPANVSLSGDGYYYTPTAEIFGGNMYSSGWKSSNQCSGASFHYETRFDGVNKLWCVSEGQCKGGDVVRCSWNGGHDWFVGAVENGGLVTDFLLRWAKTSHIGHGRSEGEDLGAGLVLEDIVILDQDVPSKREHDDNPPKVLVQSPRGHYGNPIAGCLPDEDVVNAAGGRVCAPRIGSTISDNASTSSTPPEPKCKIGGVAPFANGCPVDASVTDASRAWPICVAKGVSPDPYNQGEFHCFLVCPCSGEGFECGKDADAHCPNGAKCERGELRNRAQGVCTYGSKRRDEIEVVV